jgi:uncharacterized membrane protein
VSESSGKFFRIIGIVVTALAVAFIAFFVWQSWSVRKKEKLQDQKKKDPRVSSG